MLHFLEMNGFKDEHAAIIPCKITGALCKVMHSTCRNIHQLFAQERIFDLKGDSNLWQTVQLCLGGGGEEDLVCGTEQEKNSWKTGRSSE